MEPKDINPSMSIQLLPGVSTSSTDDPSLTGNKERTCAICGEAFRKEDSKAHEKTEKHKTAFEKFMQKKSEQRLSSHDSIEEKYFTSPGTTTVLHETDNYTSTLVVFLALRYCLENLEDSDVKISIDNEQWLYFDDIVVEVLDKKQKMVEIHSFQIKQIQSRKQILLSTLTAERGKFSLKLHCDFVSRLQDKKDYDKAHFTLFTTSDLLVEENTKFAYDDNVIRSWKDDKMKDLWSGREGILLKQETNHMADTTGDCKNICKFKLFNHEDPELDRALSKFTLLINQNKTGELKHLITKIIDEKFVPNVQITDDLIDSVRAHFARRGKYNYKLTKKQILQKACELVFTNYHHFPESLYEAKDVERWNHITETFDIIFIKNQKDIINRLYTCLNHILPKVGCSSLNIEKEKLRNESLKFEMFRGFETETSRIISVPFLYTSLWKSGLVPLVLEPEDDKDLNKIIHMTSSMKTYNLPLKVIIITDLPIDRCTLPKNLKTLINLQDLADDNGTFFAEITQEIQIPILSEEVSLEEVIKHNSHFLYEITPSCLLNMYFGRFSYSECLPLEAKPEDLIDNTLVVSDEVLRKVENKLIKRAKTPKENLEYAVNIGGNPAIVEVPADIAMFF